MNNLPLLAITMGDPAGTGPEIITKALADAEIYGLCRPVVVGDAATMRQAKEFTGADITINSVTDVAEAGKTPGQIDVYDLQNVDLPNLKLGEVSPQAGKAAYEYIVRATEMALAEEVGGIVTSA